MPFHWTVTPGTEWPPRATLKPPFSLTRVEIARSCPLRVVFEASKQYEPQVSFDARIGTAMHETLEHFTKHPPKELGDELLETVRERFRQELQRQREEADRFPRERGKPENQQRINAATAALLSMIQGLGQARSGGGAPAPGTGPDDLDVPVQVEERVTSRDGLFAGRVDRAVRDEAGLTLFDYKSSMLTDVPERYARQLQMYTEMWADTFGERPGHAFVVYPLTGRQYPVEVTPGVTAGAMAESRRAVRRLLAQTPSEELATPGDVCKVCTFKPWCESFWKWTAAGGRILEAQNRSLLGFQGRVTEAGRQKDNLVLKIAWHPQSLATLIAPWGQFSHLQDLAEGVTVRVLGARLQGQVRSPKAVATAWTEVFLVQS